MSEYRRRVLLSSAEIQTGLSALAERLRPRLEGHELTVIPIMGGAMIFAADLIRQLPPGLILDFLRIQTYGDATSPQSEPKVEWRPDPANVKGRTVLLLDDILDTGRTMQEARRFLLEECEAAEVLCVVLVDKPARRALDITADDCVLHLEEDLFLVGCGLDWAGKYRNLPELCFIEQVATS